MALTRSLTDLSLLSSVNTLNWTARRGKLRFSFRKCSGERFFYLTYSRQLYPNSFLFFLMLLPSLYFSLSYNCLTVQCLWFWTISIFTSLSWKVDGFISLDERLGREGFYHHLPHFFHFKFLSSNNHLQIPYISLDWDL